MRPALVLALVACSARPAPRPPLPSADEVVAPYLKVRFGQGIADPHLEPTGWREGAHETFLDATLEAGVEVKTEAGVVQAVAITFAEDRIQAVERDLHARLGDGIACAVLPEGVANFRPVLWQTSDGGAVTGIRKPHAYELHVEKPAPPSFDEAWKSCAPP